MALADRIKPVEKKPAFERWLDGLSESNRATVETWLKDTLISNQEIADSVRADEEEDDFKGYPAGKDTIAKARSRRGIVRSA